jgi:hypothetical protein
MNAVTLKPIKMQDGSQSLRLDSPYHPNLPARLRALGGKWNADKKTWYMPTDMEQQLRDLCVEFFSVDPMATPETDLVTVDVQADDLSYDDTCWLFGREILRRPGRDVNVRVGDGVSVINGGFRSTGGSMRYPNIGPAQDGTVIRVRNVSRKQAQEFVTENPNSLIIEQEQANQNIAFVQAKQLAEQFGPLLAKLSDAEKQEIFAIMQSQLKTDKVE